MNLDDAMKEAGYAPGSIERRGSPRVALTTPVEILCEGRAEPVKGPSLDIGLGGVCVQLDDRIDLGSIRGVTIRVDRNEVALEGTGVWQRRTKGNGRFIVGVEFLPVRPRESWLLWGLLSTRASGLARFLVECSELEELTIDIAMDIALRTRRRQFEPDSSIYRKGHIEPEGRSIFVIMSGNVDLIRETEDGRTLTLGRASKGSVIGGLPLVMDIDHSESGLCTDNVELLEIDEFAYDILSTEKPVAARVLARAVIQNNLEHLGSLADYAIADLSSTDPGEKQR